MLHQNVPLLCNFWVELTNNLQVKLKNHQIYVDLKTTTWQKSSTVFLWTTVRVTMPGINGLSVITCCLVRFVYSELHLKAFWESESLRSGMDCAALKVWRHILHILLVIIFEFESQNCVWTPYMPDRWRFTQMHFNRILISMISVALLSRYYYSFLLNFC